MGSSSLDDETVVDLCQGKTFCRAVFENLHLAIGGEVKPCCEFKGVIGNAKKSSLEEIWRSAELNAVRENLLRGERDKRCWKCWEAEDAGSTSLRRGFNSAGPVLAKGSATIASVTAASPRSLDLRFSNLCNLSCRTCGPDYSTKWYSDAQITEGWNRPRHALVETFASTELAAASIGPALETVQSIYFAGGEPLLHEGHYAVLERLIDLGRTNVNLTYNSNLTELGIKNLQVIPLWSRFQSVELLASIDGHKALGELVREGLSWDKFSKNIQRIRRECAHVQIKFSITVSVLNVLSLADLCHELQRIDPQSEPDFHFNILQEPPRYSIQILPAELKQEALRRLERFAIEFDRERDDRAMRSMIEPIVNFMMFKDRSAKIGQFRARTLQLDELRDRNTARVIPELAPLLVETRTQKFVRTARQSIGKIGT